MQVATAASAACRTSIEFAFHCNGSGVPGRIAAHVWAQAT